MKSTDHGDLIDIQAWDQVIGELRSEWTDALIVTPPSSIYVDEASSSLPALRAQGPPSSWFGVPSLPEDIKQTIKQQDLMWVRTAELVKEAIAMNNQWVVA